MEHSQADLNQLPQNALQLILQSGKFGIKGAKRLFAIAFLFGICNLLLVVYGFYTYFGNSSEEVNGLFLLVLLIVGILFTALAIYKAYQFVLVELFGYAYQQSSDLFEKLSDVLVDNSEKILQKSSQNKSVSQAIDYASIIKSKFENTPKIVSKVVGFLFNRIPLFGMLKDLQTDIAQGNKKEASSKLYVQMDTFITQSIFGSNNTQWVFWLLPLNVLVMIAIIFLKLS